MLETVELPLYFVLLLTCSYDLQSFMLWVFSEIPWLPALSFLYLCRRHNPPSMTNEVEDCRRSPAADEVIASGAHKIL